MTNVNSHLAAAAMGITNPIDFATPATNKDKVQALTDAISKEGTDPTYHRLFLDEMSPAARDSLYVMLVALKAAITNVA
jgi:hypothetical protein